jgi:hypothetical protein
MTGTLLFIGWAVCVALTVAFMMGASRKDNYWRDNK